MAVNWSRELYTFYNDAFSAFLGPERHPSALGRPGRDVWADIWPTVGADLESVLMSGEGLLREDQRVRIARNGGVDDAAFTYSYSPIEGASAIEGVFVIASETTADVAAAEGRRRAEAMLKEHAARLDFLDTLSGTIATSGDADSILATTTRLVAGYLGADICAYADMDEDQDHFTIRGDWAAPGLSSIVGYYSLRDFGALAVERLGAGVPLIINNARAELPANEAATFNGIGVNATVCFPLVKDGRLTALMAVHSARSRTWTDRDIALLSDVTQRCWAHIERVRAEAARHDAEQRLRDALEKRVAHSAEQLEQSQEQFRMLVQGVTDYALYMLDRHGNVSSWNVGAERIKGYTPEEIIGQHFSRFYTEEDIAAGEPQRALDTAIAEGRFEREAERVRKDGSRFWAHVIIDAIRNPAGEHVGFAKITRDMSERREAQLAIEAAREQLFQAQKMEAIGNLTGGVAHDFNNLLMAVSGSLELLSKRANLDPASQRLLQNAIEGADRGRSLTSRMLAFARRQELKAERFDPEVLVRGMGELLERSLGPTIEVTFDLQHAPPMVETDPNQLESALLNLAVNARDAMGGEGRLTFALSTVQAPATRLLNAGPFVRLSVADTGEGMDAETLARATEPFFTTKGVGKGTGLGLSMVQGFAEQSGGRFRLTSTPGRGTTAEIWLPAFPRHEEAVQPPPARPSPTAPQEGANRMLKVLAVDDDALVLMNTVAMLEDLGHTVDSAYSAREALGLVEKQNYDLLVTDHAMPQMTGAQLAAEVRALRPEMPIILATGYAELPPGGDNTLPRLGKPFSQKELAAAVAQAAGGR